MNKLATTLFLATLAIGSGCEQKEPEAHYGRTDETISSMTKAEIEEMCHGHGQKVKETLLYGRDDGIGSHQNAAYTEGRMGERRCLKSTNTFIETGKWFNFSDEAL